MAAKINLAAGAVSEDEWLFFMVGAVPDNTVTEKHPMPELLRSKGVNEKRC